MDNLETREDINKNVILIDLPDDYWEFVGNNLPDYHRRDEVLHSDIMEKFLDDELYDEDDLNGMGDMIDDYSGVDRILEVNKANVSVVVNKLNTELYIEALQARIEELENRAGTTKRYYLFGERCVSDYLDGGVDNVDIDDGHVCEFDPETQTAEDLLNEMNGSFDWTQITKEEYETLKKKQEA